MGCITARGQLAENNFYGNRFSALHVPSILAVCFTTKASMLIAEALLQYTSPFRPHVHCNGQWYITHNFSHQHIPAEDFRRFRVTATPAHNELTITG